MCEKKTALIVSDEDTEVINAATLTEKESALLYLAERKANPPEKIDNASLYAGSLMFYYCKICEGTIVLLESFTCAVPKLCVECNFLKEMGWLE